MSKLFAKRRSVLIKESDLANALKLFDRRHIGGSDIEIRRCTGLERDKWCISAKATDSQWTFVERELRRASIRMY